MHQEKRPTLKEKLAIYENILHAIQLNAEICLNSDNMKKIIGRICDWSYAHRVGNGALSEEEQQNQIDTALYRLQDWQNG